MSDRRRALRELRQLRERLLGRLAQPGGGPVTGDDAEQAAATLAREVQHLDLDRIRQRLHDVEAAIARITEGRYARCVDCGEDIPAKRLEAIPEAATCLRCAERREWAAARLEG